MLKQVSRKDLLLNYYFIREHLAENKRLYFELADLCIRYNKPAERKYYYNKASVVQREITRVKKLYLKKLENK